MRRFLSATRRMSSLAEVSVRSPAALPTPVDPRRHTLRIALPASEGGGSAELVYTIERGAAAAAAAGAGASGDGASAAVVVALHGAPGSTFDWRYLSSPLRARAPAATLLRLEVPGFGGSSAALSPHSSPAGAALARALASRALPAVCAAEGLAMPGTAGARARWLLLGHSIGCELAQLLAVELLRGTGASAGAGAGAGGGAGRDARPGAAPPVAGLVLVNPIGLRPHRGMRPMAAVRLAAALLDLPGPLGAAWRRTLRTLWVRVFGFPNRIKEDDVAWGQRRAASIDWQRMREVTAALCAAGLPASVLFSANDHLVEPAVSRELCVALGAKRVVVSSDAGHWGNKLAADDIAKLIADMLETGANTPATASAS